MDINQINGRLAYKILREYSGVNPYILAIKKDYEKSPNKLLTTTQIQYVIRNHEKEPKYLDKIVEINEYIGSEIKKMFSLRFLPNKIKVIYLLGETDKAYHIIGQVSSKSEPKMFFLSKNGVYEDFNFKLKEVNIDFDKYNERLQKVRGYKLLPHQEEGVKFLLARDGAILADSMGVAKGLGDSQMVMTPKGKKKHGELVVGEYVIGSDGKKTKVLGVFPLGDRELYRVTFNDGFYLDVTDDHLWNVKLVDGSDDATRTYPTNHLYSDSFVYYGDRTHFLTKDNKPRWYIPIVSNPIEFENDITYDMSYETGYELSKIHKEIPNSILYSSIDIRQSFFKGFIDGLELVNNSIIVTTTNDGFVNSLNELVLGLGGLVFKEVNNHTTTLNIKFLNNNVCEFGVDSNLKRCIVNVERLHKTEPSKCIRVEADDSLYLGDHAIVTHNTLTTIVASLETRLKRILVICPSSVKINWEREINTFTENTTIIDGRVWNQARFTIMNYDILQNFHTLESKIDPNEPPTYIARELVNANFDLIIIDEAHNLRNKQSIRGEIVSELCNKFGNPIVWLLTGTPVANRPKDFYNLLKLVRCNVADDYNFYLKRYCDAVSFNKELASGKVKRINISNGATNLEELANRTKHLMLRRLKTEVVDMPEKQIIRTHHKLSKETRQEYDRVWEEYLIKRKEEKKRGNVDRGMVEIGLLRKFMAMEAVQYSYEMAMEAINQGSKVVIFTTFNEEQTLLAEKFGNICVQHNGSMNLAQKQASVDAFQTKDSIKVFLGNVISAGVGITLTAGNVTIFNSFSWVPGDNAQAEDRCIFEGQLVTTENGDKNIEEIEIGERVLTHLGNYKTVVDKHTHLEVNKLKYSLEAYGKVETISITEDHKLYVYDFQYKEFKWVEARDLNIDKHGLTLKHKEPNQYGITQIGDYMVYNLKSITISQPIEGHNRVYDLSVEGDHSFVVGGVNVHNCWRIGQANDCIVYYQVFDDTVSETVLKTLDNKTDVILQLIGTETESDLIQEQIISLIYDE